MVRIRLSIVGSALVAATVAGAQPPPAVLHEYVPRVGEEEEAALLVGQADGEPQAIVYDGEILPMPEGGALQADEHVMVSLPGDSRGPEEAGRRSPNYRPDRNTSLDRALSYFAVFTPTIAPFKRVTALDAVILSNDRVPVLTVASTESDRVELASADSPPDLRARDRFWGNVVVDFANGTRVPLPSVSPESQILSLRVEPLVRVHVEKDDADNFYAVLDDSQASTRRVRLVFLTDAPQGYFNQPPPGAPSDALADIAQDLPGQVERDALRFAEELGLRRGMPLDRTLSTLTEYFRGFEESDVPPTDTGNIYLDLARGRRGICRHRAYAFMITALALGIPTRFVQNEAHAWVEVNMAGAGFSRIDLGGAAGRLEARGADDRPRYRPRHPDPFPRPAPYAGSAGESSAREGDRQAETDSTQASDERRETHSGPTDENEISSPGNSGAEFDAEETGRQPLILTTDRRDYEVFRGRVLSVSGRVTEVDGRGVAGMRVEVLLMSRTRAREVLLGVTVSHEHGWFQGSFGVPPDLPVGEYQLLVQTPGDGAHGPAHVQ